jgi:hypothetical protein
MNQVTYGISVMGVIELIIVGCVVFWLGTKWVGSGPRATAPLPAAPAHHRNSKASGLVAAGVVAAIILCGTFFLAIFSVRVEQHQIAELSIAEMRDKEAALMERHQIARSAAATPRITIEGEDGAKPSSENVTAEAAPQPKTDRPAWTAETEKVRKPGQIPDVLLVRKSELCANEAEAVREATALAIAALKRRLEETYPQMATWQMSEAAFRKHSQKQQFVEQQLHDFKSFEETMFTAFIQFEDSPQVRESLVHEWQLASVDQRIKFYGLGAGLAALGLGFVSSVLRIIGSEAGPSRQRAIVAAVAIAAVAGVGLLIG